MLLVLLAACNPDGTGSNYAGTKMSDYFKFDGNRTAKYNNEDAAITWQLVVEKLEQTSLVDGREVVTFEYSNGADGTVYGSVQWSSANGDEVLVHGYSLGATGDLLTFDPAVRITDDDDAMRAGDATTTDTTDSGGASWTFVATFEESVPECPSTLSDDFAKCVRMTIDDGDGDPLAGPLFAGDFTLVGSYGPVFMTIPGWETEWELTQYDYDI